MNAYVISLDSTRHERADPTCQHFSKARRIDRVFMYPAVTPEDFELDEVTHPFARATIRQGLFQKETNKNQHETRSRDTTMQLSHETQVACALSHISLWNLCKELGEPIIVAEDDSRPNNLDTRLGYLKSDPAMDDADMVLLQCASFPFSSEAVDKSLLRRVTDYWGATCYYLTPEGAEVLLEHALPITMHIDCYMSYCITGSGLQVFSVPNANDQSVLSPSTLMHQSIWGVRVVRLQFYIAALGVLLVVMIVSLIWVACKKGAKK